MNTPTTMTPHEKVQKLKTARDLLIARCKLLTPYSQDWYMTRKQLQQVTEEGEVTAEQVRVQMLKASFEKSYPSKRSKDWQCPICRQWKDEFLDDPSSWLPCCQERICGDCRDKQAETTKKCPSCGSKEYFPLNKLDEVYKIQNIDEPWAHLRMAMLLEENGRFEKSAEYLWKAVDQGHPVAICQLGQVNYTGSNPDIPQSNENARALFLKSAQQGYAEAQYNLGLFCLEEEAENETPIDASQPNARALQAQTQRRKMQIRQEGLRWISLAAVGGSLSAQGMLATLYLNSVSQDSPVKKNLFLSKYWAQLGADKGDGSCKLILAQVLMILASQTFDRKYDQVGYNPVPRVLFLLRQTAADERSSIQTETNKENALKTLRKMESQLSVSCANCGAQNVPLSQCKQCRGVHYCGKDCSTEHWKKGHKLDCLKKEETAELEDCLRKIAIAQPPPGTGLAAIAEDLATTSLGPSTTANEMIEPIQQGTSLFSGNVLN